MIFRRLIFSALMVGVICGLLLSATQILSVNPIILYAETFEVSGSHSHTSENEHSHDVQAELATNDHRDLYTIYANISAGIGFSAVLLSFMSQFQIMGITRLTALRGLLWGGAGFITFFVVPAFGIPPDIPGIESAPVEQRQIWWLIAVVCVGLGLLALAFAPLRYKIFGVTAMFFPYLLNIPRHEGPVFTHVDPDVVKTLTELHQQFIVVSSLNNLLFWLALGFFSALSIKLWIHGNRSEGTHANI